MNTILNEMKKMNNVTLTENGGITYKSTMNGLQDLFALGASYRSRSETDVIYLFKKAFEEDETYALKCLFYLRDVRGGQGERRFFRTVVKWLACNHTAAMKRNLKYVPEFGRWDDMYAFVDTPLEKEAFDIMYEQLKLDVSCKTPSLLAKWLKSTNTSSKKSCELGVKTREAFGMSAKQYRKTLAILREKIRIVERLMSENRWDEIEFDKIPSRAGLIYRNAFARHDLMREQSEKNVQTYADFAKSKETKVNAKALNPCEVVHEATKVYRKGIYDTDRLMVNKYWENLHDYFQNAVFNGVAVVDTSGSMTWGYNCGSIQPIDVAISLGMYCAEKCNPESPWANNYITFSREARLVSIDGVDFVDKVRRIYDANLCENTNIQKVFDLILKLAIEHKVKQEDMPENIVVISDMEFDSCAYPREWTGTKFQSEMEKIATVWERCGYKMPKLVFWNVDARNDNIPMRDNGRVTFVSGYSPVIYEMLMTGKTGIDLIMEKLNSDRYKMIH